MSHEGGESVVDEFSERIVWRGVRGRSNVRRELQSAFASEVCLEPIAHAHRVEDATTPKNRRRVEFGDGTETRTGTRGGSLRGSLRGAWIAGVAGGVALVVGASPIVLAHLHDLGGEIDPTTNPRLVRIRRGTSRPRRRRGVRRRRGRSVRSARLRFRTLPRAAHALPDHLLDHLDVARPGASLGASSSPPRGSPGVGGGPSPSRSRHLERSHLARGASRGGEPIARGDVRGARYRLSRGRALSREVRGEGSRGTRGRDVSLESMDAREARDEVASVERVTRLCGRLERGLARGDGGYSALDACFRRGAFADGVYASEKGFAGVSEKGAMGRGVSAESEDAVADAVELGHGAGEVLVVFRADALHLLGALDARVDSSASSAAAVSGPWRRAKRARGEGSSSSAVRTEASRVARASTRSARRRAASEASSSSRGWGWGNVDASPRSTAAASRAHAAVRSDANSATSAPRAAVSSMARQIAGWNPWRRTGGGGRPSERPPPTTGAHVSASIAARETIAGRGGRARRGLRGGAMTVSNISSRVPCHR